MGGHGPFGPPFTAAPPSENSFEKIRIIKNWLNELVLNGYNFMMVIFPQVLEEHLSNSWKLSIYLYSATTDIAFTSAENSTQPHLSDILLESINSMSSWSWKLKTHWQSVYQWRVLDYMQLVDDDSYDPDQKKKPRKSKAGFGNVRHLISSIFG